MKLQENIDYVLVKRGGYFGKGRMDQYHGNLVVTRNRIIINVLQNVNPMDSITGSSTESTEYIHGSSLNPITQLKYSVSDIKSSTKDLSNSFSQAKEDFRKLGDFGRCLKILQEVAADCENIEEFETRAAGMGEDNPKSLNISLTIIQSIKFNWFGPAKVFLMDGAILKVFITGNKGNVKRFLANYIK